MMLRRFIGSWEDYTCLIPVLSGQKSRQKEEISHMSTYCETWRTEVNAKRVLVLVPTTGSVNRIVRIEARHDLAASQIFHRHWRQPISRFYAPLTAGPLAALGAPVTPGVYRLWLAEEMKSGNSWELPVLLAHLVDALGHELVTDPAQADVVLWATGEIDADLQLRARDYRLAAKAAHSGDELRRAAAAGARIIAIVPGTEDASPLHNLLAASGALDWRAESVDSVGAARAIVEVELGPAADLDRIADFLVADILASPEEDISSGAADGNDNVARLAAEMRSLLPAKVFELYLRRVSRSGQNVIPFPVQPSATQPGSEASAERMAHFTRLIAAMAAGSLGTATAASLWPCDESLPSSRRRTSSAVSRDN
jgi:hypothetical protein